MSAQPHRKKRFSFWSRNRVGNVYQDLMTASFPDGFAAIYAIINRINGKRYIGQTICLNSRIQVHRCMLNNGYHHVPELQVDYRKYGPEWFEVRVLEYVADPSQLEAKEDEWLARFDPRRLYNSPRDYEHATRLDRLRKRRPDHVQGNLFEFGFISMV